MEERGRRLSAHGGQHISPVPSQDNYHDALTGLDPSIGQNTFSTGRFNTAHNDIAYSQAQEQPYLTNYIPQMGTAYLNQNFNNDYMLHNQSYANNFQDLSMNQFASNIGQVDNSYATNINPADLNKMSPQENPSPQLLSPEVHNSTPQSPASTNGQYHTPSHSRNTSLDPNSAYTDWQGVQFRQHQRTPSDVSDVSSVNNSPYLHTVEIEGSHSPMFTPQQDTSTFGIDNFNLAETGSPGSNYVSPRLMPQQQEGLGLSQEVMLNQNYQVPQEVYTQDHYQSMHNRNQSTVSDIGRADQFEPPTINIEPAPVSRQASFGPPGQQPDALSPPANSSRGRNRSKSDVTFTRPLTARSVSPGPGRQRDSLSIARSPSPSSRSSSPGVSEGRISKDRRASTSAINNNNREYILDLADPNRPSGSNGNSTRIQKHPATFQCTLCPKRFTRAYNLRSHLRTHTDERPFVCTVCGKAFARQHDRKRHEGLHSGEKKFVCKGELSHSPGQTWGCGRRFARADALGRHFRSEAGRVCIKPLLDEEAAERRQNMMMEQAQQQVAMLHPVPQQMMVPDMNNFALPAALLAQYPALQNIDWSALQQGQDDGELSDMGVGGYEDGGISDSGSYAHNGQW